MLLVAGLFCLPHARAASFSSNPIMDAFVTTGAGGSLVNSNYGGAGVLGVAASGLPQGEFQSVLQFDLSGAFNSFNSQFGAGDWTVQSVTLRLSSAPANNGILNTPAAGHFTVYRMVDNLWTEGNGAPASPSSTGITYNSLQSLINNSVDENLGTFSYNGAASGANNYTLQVTSGFIADLMGGNDESFRLAAADSSVSYLFNSRNFNNSANWPQLTIVAVPEPGAVWVLAMGGAMAGCVGILRRRVQNETRVR